MWMDYVSGQEACRCPPESIYHERGTKQQVERMTYQLMSDVISHLSTSTMGM